MCSPLFLFRLVDEVEEKHKVQGLELLAFKDDPRSFLYLFLIAQPSANNPRVCLIGQFELIEGFQDAASLLASFTKLTVVIILLCMDFVD